MEHMHTRVSHGGCSTFSGYFLAFTRVSQRRYAMISKYSYRHSSMLHPGELLPGTRVMFLTPWEVRTMARKYQLFTVMHRVLSWRYLNPQQWLVFELVVAPVPWVAVQCIYIENKSCLGRHNNGLPTNSERSGLYKLGVLSHHF